MAQGSTIRAALAILAAAIVVPPVPARAAAPAAAATRPISYAAIGDSYASGAGTGVFDIVGAPCLRSSQSYPSLLTTRRPTRAFIFVACSGATALQTHRYQVPRIPRDADLVTVTVGGNDAGFGAVLRTCSTIRSDAVCANAVRLGETAARSTAPAGLATTLAGIRRTAPHARIVVLGYPRLFELGPCAASGAPSEKRRKAINHGADVLNAALASTTRTARATFVDVRARFAGHGVCAPAGQEWLNRPSLGPAAYHPNATGYAQGYLPALEQALETGP